MVFSYLYLIQTTYTPLWAVVSFLKSFSKWWINVTFHFHIAECRHVNEEWPEWFTERARCTGTTKPQAFLNCGGLTQGVLASKVNRFFKSFFTNQIVLLKRQLHALITAIEKRNKNETVIVNFITIQPCIYTIDFYYKYKPVISIYFRLLRFRIAWKWYYLMLYQYHENFNIHVAPDG